MSDLGELNYPAYQYYTENISTVRDICQPLFDLGVKRFAYFKVFEDGSYILSSPHEEFVKQHFLTIKNQGVSPLLEVESAPLGQIHHVIYPSRISLWDKTKDPLLCLAHSHDIWHIYVIYKNKLEYVEGYCFGMNIADEYAHQFYTKNIALLEHFCFYYHERTVDLINADDKKKRGYYQHQFNFSRISVEDKLSYKAEEFLLKTQLKRLTILGRNHEVRLSKRETECLRYLVLGKSAKEIARNLCLSHRTIEFYLKNIKDKTGYTSKTQIVSAYLAHVTHF
jgi:DNA-binding CsgD family transcriptional regulator